MTFLPTPVRATMRPLAPDATAGSAPRPAEHRKITSYYGEADRHDGELLGDRLAEIYAAHRVQASIVLRGSEGFGSRHRLQSDQIEVLSLDSPLVSIAIDTAERAEAILRDVVAVQTGGMITVERVRLLDPELTETRTAEAIRELRLAEATGEQVRLVVHVGRRERTRDGRPALRAVVAALHDQGVAGATALLGVDGTRHGRRRRAAFLSGNREVPVMILSVGDVGPISAAVAALGELLERPLITAERVRICKRDGELLERPPLLRDEDHDGLSLWQKLTVHGSHAHRHGRHSVHQELLRQLRAAGGAGATTLSGVWGYHGDHAPHGDRFLQATRHVPVITTIVDRPSRIAELFAIVDGLTATAGLVTSEIVPARRASAADGHEGGLRLAADR
jgi:PII-like signaling protein